MELKPNQAYGKICPHHPELNGLRYRRECVNCKASAAIVWREVNRDAKKIWREVNKEKIAATSKAWYEANREQRAVTNKTYRESNREQVAATSKAWYESNRERIVATGKVWREANREEILAAKKAWREANREYIAADRYLRYQNDPVHRARVQRKTRFYQQELIPQRTPPWADWGEIEAWYAEARAKGLNVDHVIPLKHPLVTAFHCPANFQLLTGEANNSKHNKFDIDDPDRYLARPGTYDWRE